MEKAPEKPEKPLSMVSFGNLSGLWGLFRRSLTCYHNKNGEESEGSVRAVCDDSPIEEATGSTVPDEIERGILENRRQIGEPLLHLLPFAQLVIVVEVGHCNDPCQILGPRQFRDDFIDPIPNIFLPANIKPIWMWFSN